MMFAVKSEKCMGCKTLISSKERSKKTSAPLCSRCEDKEGEIFLQKLSNVKEQQAVYNQLWTECQRCQGSFHQEVICSNKDCAIFYKRKKTQIDLQVAQEALDKFTW